MTTIRIICVVSRTSFEVFAFSISDKESIDRLSRATETYMLNHLDRNFDTLDFYRSVTKD